MKKRDLFPYKVISGTVCLSFAASVFPALKTMVKKTAGYILIYVIGVLIFLGIVGLGVAYTLRINAQLVLNEKEVLQNDRLDRKSVV